MEVYYVVNAEYNYGHNSLIFSKLGAYLDKNMAELAVRYYLYINGYQDNLFEILCASMGDVYIGKYLYYMDIYKGYDYISNGIIDIRSQSELFPYIDALKQSEIYQYYLREVEKDKDNFIIKPDGSMGSKDDLFDDSIFLFGDYMEGKWSLSIDKLRIYKGSEDGLESYLHNHLYNRMQIE